MIGRSPNEISQELARINRDARLRRLKAVRSAASRVQQERLSLFRKHFDREKTIVEEVFHIQRARITLADISALEDELRLALTQMGVAHQNALSFNARITEEMLRENEAFKAHVTMSNLRFEAVIELIRAFRYQQEALKSAQAEQRVVAFERAKELLQKIAAINKRAELRYAHAPLCHPYDSIHELNASGTFDYRVTRIHVDANSPDAISLARVEDQRCHERTAQAEMERQRRTQVAERRAKLASGIARSRKTAKEVQASLHEALVQERQRKLQISRQRSTLPAHSYQSKIKRAFESALPDLRSARRQQLIREAEQRFHHQCRTEPTVRNSSRSESPDDLLERFSRRQDAAVIPNNMLKNIVNVADCNESSEQKEEDLGPQPVPGASSAAMRSNLDADDSSMQKNPELESEQESVPLSVQPMSKSESFEESHFDSARSRRSVAFSVIFDEEQPSPMPNEHRKTSPLPSSPTLQPLLTPSDPSKLESHTQQITPSSLPQMPESNQLQSTATDNLSEKNEPDVPKSVIDKPTSQRSASPAIVRPDSPRALSESLEPQSLVDRNYLDRSESVPLSSVNSEPRNSSPRSSLSPPPHMENDIYAIAENLDINIAAFPVDLSMDDLTELDRRAEELLQNHIPTTPQLLALPRDPAQTLLDFHLDETEDNEAIQMLGVDSEALAASFAQTLDETLEFLRQSRDEIDNLRSQAGPIARHSRSSADDTSSAQARLSISVDEKDAVDSVTIEQEYPESEPRSQSTERVKNDRHVTVFREPESLANQTDFSGGDQTGNDGSMNATRDELNTSGLSSERTTDDDRSSSLQEQFRANIALIERIEQRRAESRRRRQLRQSL